MRYEVSRRVEQGKYWLVNVWEWASRERYMGKGES